MKMNVSNYWKGEHQHLLRKQKALLSNPGNILKRKAILSYVSQYVALSSKTLKILDVGGGLGDLAFEFFQKRYKGDFVILDIARMPLRVGKKTLQHFKSEFIQADAQKLPFKSQTFDIVICSEVLEHLPNDSVALKETARVLKDNGIILITIPYMERQLSVGHLRRYDLESFNRLCNDAHLEIKDISFRCRSIHVIRNILRKLCKRKVWGEKESAFYLKAPVISQLLVLILKPIDNALANRPSFSKLLKFLNEATLVACLQVRDGLFNQK